jgi:hypothetical protein
MTPDVSVVSAGDYTNLARFLGSFRDDRNGEIVWLKRLEHWWEQNPSYSADVPRGWLLHGDDGAIVGFLGNIPRAFRSQGENRRVFCATTWRVLPSHRHASLRLYVAHVAAGKGTFLFNTTPNASVVKVLDYLKYQSLPGSSSGRSFLLPLDAGRVAAAYVRDSRQPGLRAMLAKRALAAAALPPLLRLAFSHQGTRTVSSAGPEFDVLWERTRDEVSNTSVRTAEQIRWMCFGGCRQKVVIGAFDGNDLLAYAVFKEAPEDELRVLQLFDLWPVSASPAIVRRLLAGTIDHARQNAYDMIILHDFSDRLTATFRRTGFVLTNLEPSRHYFRPGAALPSLALANSYLTGFEGDAGL